MSERIDDIDPDDPRFQQVMQAYVAATEAYLRLTSTLGIDVASFPFCLSDNSDVLDLMNACVLRLARDGVATPIEVLEVNMMVAREAHKQAGAPMYSERNDQGAMFTEIDSPVYQEFAEHLDQEGDVGHYVRMFLDQKSMIKMTPRDPKDVSEMMHFFDLPDEPDA